MRTQKVLFALTIFAGALALAQNPPAPRILDVKAGDGTLLRATFFAAGKPGPGVLLLHQSNRDRESWSRVAAQLAAAGINALTLDMRGFGESGGTKRGRDAEDVEAALEFLRLQADVDVVADDVFRLVEFRTGLGIE